MTPVVIDTLVTGLPLVPLVLGVYLVLRIRQDFDLTVEGSFALGAAVTAVALTSGVSPVAGMAVGVISGSAAGLVTSMLHLLLRIPVLMAGLVMTMALFTVTLRVLGMPTVSLAAADTVFSPFVSGPGRDADLRMSALLGAIVVALLVLFGLFLKSEIGLALRASGENPHMVRSNGVDDRRLLVLSLMLSNGLAAFGGSLMLQVQGFADVNMGTGVFLAAVGAVLLGILLFDPGGSTVVRITLAVLVGGLVYRLVLVGALRVGLPAGDLKGVTALTLVLAVAAQTHLMPALRRYRRLVRPVTATGRPSDPAVPDELTVERAHV